MALKLIKQLGVGGFGVVDLVQDEHGKEFARKTFSLNQTLTPEMTENVEKRFIREAKVQQGFQHKNIVPVVGGDLDADPPFYLMPVAVSTLADEIRSDRTLDGKFVSALSDVVAALEELHGLEIFHRDLKPQNVLRLGTGDDTYYAVSDFGLISQKDSTLSKLTTTGMAKGSDYFTAPEITSDLRKASTQSDIFSLGCILHEMVGIAARVPCQEIREDGDYGQILLSCTRNDSKRRFGSVRAVLDALVSIDTTAAIPKSDLAIELNSILDTDEPLAEAQWSRLVRPSSSALPSVSNPKHGSGWRKRGW